MKKSTTTKVSAWHSKTDDALTGEFEDHWAPVTEYACHDVSKTQTV